MLWLQLAILVLVACVQGGNAQGKGVPQVKGCQARCALRGGKCIEPKEDCKRKVIPMKCGVGESCNCCPKPKGKVRKIGKKNASVAKGKGDSNKAPKKKPKNKDASDRNGSSKSGSGKGKSDGPVKKGKKGTRKRTKDKPKKKGPKKAGTRKSGSKKGPSKGDTNKPKKKKKGKGKKKGSGRKVKKEDKNKPKKNKKVKGKEGRKGKKPKKDNNGSGKKKGQGKKKGTRKDDNNAKSDIKCANGKSVKDTAKCDKINDCGDGDDTDEKGCNYVADLTCQRCKTWDTGDVGAKYDPKCGKTGYSDHTDKAEKSDPYIGCAIKVYKNGDVVRLFESWQTNDQMGKCYEGTDYENGGPEYQYTRCWCSGNNCNKNLCEECVKP